MAAAGQVFEALLVDNTPDPERPGFLRLKIPDLSGGDPYPHLVGPMFAGWVAGGWQSIPAVKTPEGQPTRLLVHYGGDGTVRWFGTSQLMPEVANAPGTVTAVRSADGRHYISISDSNGIRIATKRNNEDFYSYIALGTDGVLQIQGSGTAIVRFNDDGFYMQSPQKHALSMGDSSFILTHGNGNSFINLAADSAQLQGKTVSIGGNTILLGDGQALPTHRYIKSTAFFTALATSLLEIVAVLATPGPLSGPLPLTNTSALAAALNTSLSAGDPYLSSRIYGG